MPKVSIVLPTYNGVKYIRESIDSIINQTFRDWELIVVNDCSTDNTLSVLMEYQNRDSRIRVISNEQNQKLPRSLNIGFNNACGEYFTWTSDDNYYLENALAEMVSHLDAHPEDMMVCADMDRIDSDGNIIGEFLRYDNERMIYQDCVGACFMYRSKVVEEIGEYNPEWFLVEDYEYWVRVLIAYEHIGHIGKTLYRYREHEGSLTTSRKAEIKKQNALLRLKNIEFIIRKLKENKELLSCIYIELMSVGMLSAELKSQFIAYMPELALIKNYNEERQSIVWGAGDFGNRVYQKIPTAIRYYADSDMNKIGTKKNGIEIISLDKMLSLSEQYQIIVAVADHKLWELLAMLYENKIAECCVYQIM